MKRTLAGMIEAGEPLMWQAIDAIRQYHAAEDAGDPAPDVERLRLLADSLYRAVTDYQVLADGRLNETFH